MNIQAFALSIGKITHILINLIFQKFDKTKLLAEKFN